MPLYPYQIEGAKWLASHQRAFLADEQGLGKTAQAITACNMVGADPVLVVCPASVISSWHRDIKTFSTGQKFTVQSYDLVAKRWQSFGGPWGAIILDEAHYLKAPSTLRTSAIYGAPKFPGLVGEAAYVWALSGTPAPNNATELFTHLKALFPESLKKSNGSAMDRWQFQQNYCVTKDTNFGLKIMGNKNVEGLKARIAPHFLRRTKEQVLPDLPEIRYEPLLLDGVGHVSDEMAGISKAELSLIKEVLKDGDAATLSAVANNMPSLRRITAALKVPVVTQWIDEFLRTHPDRKLVVFAHHSDLLFEMRAKIRAVFDRDDDGQAIITGSVDRGQRKKAIEKFQNNPKCRVFWGNIVAAGTGITLTAASDLLFLEQSWVPAENAQAAMRIHRIGQKRGCLVRYASLAGSIDEAVQRTLARKTKMISEIFS
jgi:SNF2 family DNA or RNA helicase